MSKFDLSIPPGWERDRDRLNYIETLKRAAGGDWEHVLPRGTVRWLWEYDNASA